MITFVNVYVYSKVRVGGTMKKEKNTELNGLNWANVG